METNEKTARTLCRYSSTGPEPNAKTGTKFINSACRRTVTGFSHPAATDPTLFVFTAQPDGGGWAASTYDAVTGALLNGRFPLVSMPAALGKVLFEINGNFSIGSYNLSDGAPINKNRISLAPNRGVAWAVVAGGNHLFVTTDLGIVEEFNATTGALINGDFITKGNSNDQGGILWPAIPSTGVSARRRTVLRATTVI